MVLLLCSEAKQLRADKGALTCLSGHDHLHGNTCILGNTCSIPGYIVMAAANGDTVMHVQRGFKIDKVIKFTSSGHLVQSTGPDILTVCTSGASNTTVVQYPLTDNFPRISKHTIPVVVAKLVYSSELKLYIAFCNDFRLRVYNLYFDLLTTVFTHFNATCVCFDEENNEIFAAGPGLVHCWTLQPDTFNAIQASPPLNVGLREKELIVFLSTCYHAPLLCITCIEGIYIVNTETRNQQHYIPNNSGVPLSYVAIYSPAELLAVGREDGSLQLMCYMRGSGGKTNRSLTLLKSTHRHLCSLFIHTELPYLFASYPDGIIIVWNLIAEIQALFCLSSNIASIPLHKYNLQSPISAASLTFDNRIMCHSQTNCSLLILEQVEDLLTTLYSPIKSINVKHYNGRQRYIVQTYHGFIKVISPHSGKARTALYPLTVPRMLRAAHHNMAEEVFYVALKTGEIVVYDTRLNPCIPVEFWAPSNAQQEITCLDMIDHSIVGSLMLAGLRSGCLAILYARDCLIGQPCPAHDGPVVMMTSSETDQLINKNPVLNLVSYGTDGIMQVWGIEIKLDTKKQLVMHYMTSLRLKFQPLHSKILNTKLCLATIKQQVLVYKLPHGDLFHVPKLKSLPHNPLDDHSKAITSLSRCVPLSLFATSSCDGFIKIWNDIGQLLCNINIEMNVTSVCFDDLSLCLLAGFQNHLQIIPPNRYLPQKLVSSHKVIETKVEYSIPYRQNADLWYDCQKIPTLPILPHARLHAADYIATPNPFALRLISQPQYDPRILSDGIKSIREMGIIDPDEIKSIKHQLSLKEIKTSESLEDAFSRNFSDFDVSENLRRMEEEDLSFRPEREKSHYQLFPEAELTPLERVSSSGFPIAPDGYIPNSVVRGKVNHEPIDHVLQRILIKQYKLLENNKYAVAKRRRIKRVLIDLKLMDEYGAFIDPNNRHSTKQRRSVYEESDEESEEESSSEEVAESEPSSEASDYYGNLFGDQWVANDSIMVNIKERERVDSYVPVEEDYKYEEPPKPKRKQPAFLFDIELHEEVEEEKEQTSDALAKAAYAKKQSQQTRGTGVKNIKMGSSTSGHLLHKTSKTFMHDSHPKRSTTTSFKVPLKTKKISLATEPIVRENSVSTITEARSEILYRVGTPFYDFEYRNNLSTPNVGKRMERYGHRDVHVSEPEDSDQHTGVRYRPSIENLMSTLNRIIKSSWFPSSTLSQMGFTIESLVSSIGRLSNPNASHLMDSEMTLDWVIDTLVGLLDKNDMSITEDIADALAALSNNRYITTAQKNATLRGLFKKSHDANAPKSIKEHTQDLLSQLDFDDETLQMILKALLSEDESKRQAAFTALENLTGITDRAGLHALLIERGLIQHVVMNENEVLNNLAQRVKEAEEIPTLSMLKPEKKPKAKILNAPHDQNKRFNKDIEQEHPPKKKTSIAKSDKKKRAEDLEAEKGLPPLAGPTFYHASIGGYSVKVSINSRDVPGGAGSYASALREGLGATTKGKKIYSTKESDSALKYGVLGRHNKMKEFTLPGVKRDNKVEKRSVAMKSALIEDDYSSNYASTRSGKRYNTAETAYNEIRQALMSKNKTLVNDDLMQRSGIQPNIGIHDDTAMPLYEGDQIYQGETGDMKDHLIPGHTMAYDDHTSIDRDDKDYYHTMDRDGKEHPLPYYDDDTTPSMLQVTDELSSTQENQSVSQSKQKDLQSLDDESDPADFDNLEATLTLPSGFLDAKNIKYLPQKEQPFSLLNNAATLGNYDGCYKIPNSDDGAMSDNITSTSRGMTVHMADSKTMRDFYSPLNKPKKEALSRNLRHGILPPLSLTEAHLDQERRKLEVLRRSNPYYSMSVAARREIIGLSKIEAEIEKKRLERRKRENRESFYHEASRKWNEFEWCDIAAMLLNKDVTKPVQKRCLQSK